MYHTRERLLFFLSRIRMHDCLFPLRFLFLLSLSLSHTQKVTQQKPCRRRWDAVMAISGRYVLSNTHMTYTHTLFWGGWYIHVYAHLVHTRTLFGDVTHSYESHASFICVTPYTHIHAILGKWCIHTYTHTHDTHTHTHTHILLWRDDLFIRVTCLIHTCDTIHTHTRYFGEATQSHTHTYTHVHTHPHTLFWGCDTHPRTKSRQNRHGPHMLPKKLRKSEMTVTHFDFLCISQLSYNKKLHNTRASVMW